MNKTNIAIIGGGVIGLTIAEAFLRNGIKDVVILEKNNMVMQETSSHNSGLIHGGFDATPGSLKAKFNVEGRHLFEERFLTEGTEHFKNLPIKSFILAYNEADIDELDRLYKQGIENGLKDEEMDIISGDEVRAIDGNISEKVLKALVCHTSWVIDPLEFGHYIQKESTKMGLKTMTNFEVSSIKEDDNKKIIIESVDNQSIEANFVINAAGVWAENIARLVEEKPDFKIESKRGQYLILDKTQGRKIKNNVYFLTPSKNGKGVVVAPQFDGRVLVGPSAEDGVPFSDLQMVTKNGLKFVRRIGLKINPTLNMSRIETVMAGSRSINLKGNDYHIAMSNSGVNMFHVAGMQSPALSGCLSIAEYVYESCKHKI